MDDHRNLKEVIDYWRQGEINSFINVWLSAYSSLIYCYIAAKFPPSGAARLAAFLPVVVVLLLLPLQLHSTNLIGITAFFLSWLATFKLFMLAFDRGPLADPRITFTTFLAVSSLPIKLREETENPKKEGKKSMLNYGVKFVLYVLMFKIYDSDDHIHPKLITVAFSLHIYLCLEIILAAAAVAARGLIGADLEPQSDEPYLLTSLQDFWGRRWNLMVTRILRPSVYLPAMGWSEKVIGRKWAPLPAVMATFVVSGLMHELIYYYLRRVRPTWEVTWFFVLHGGCLTAEIFVKKVVGGRWRLPTAVGRILTVGLVLTTALWLFFPQLLRCNGLERGLSEVAAIAAFFKDLNRALYLMLAP